MLECLKQLPSYLGPLEPKKGRRNLLDWICSGISILIIVGSLVGIVLWQHQSKQDMWANPYQIESRKPKDNLTDFSPVSSFNPANNK